MTRPLLAPVRLLPVRLLPIRALPVRALLAGLLLLAVLAPGASAQTPPGGGSGGGSSGGNGTGGGEVTVGIQVGESLPGQPGGGPGSNRSTGSTAQVNLVTYYWRGPLPGNGCAGLGADVVGPVVLENNLYQYVRYDRTVEPPVTEVLQTTCFPPETAPPPPPPPPPAPPTMEEITRVAKGAVFTPAVTVSPPGDGLTGLETRFWYEGQPVVTAGETVRGYQVVATMRPTMYLWETGDQRPGHLLASTSPGSAAAPAASWVYEAKADYRVFIQVVWDGTWTFSGWGSSAAGDLATIRATGARDYVVNEVRSVLSE